MLQFKGRYELGVTFLQQRCSKCGPGSAVAVLAGNLEMQTVKLHPGSAASEAREGASNLGFNQGSDACLTLRTTVLKVLCFVFLLNILNMIRFEPKDLNMDFQGIQLLHKVEHMSYIKIICLKMLKIIYNCN